MIIRCQNRHHLFDHLVDYKDFPYQPECNVLSRGYAQKVKLVMTESGRQLAATLGRIYPYRAAKQQAPGVAAADAEGFPNRSGMTRFPVKPGMTGRAGDDG